MLTITRGERDKEEVIFYHNHDYDLEIDEGVYAQCSSAVSALVEQVFVSVFVTYWRSISMDGSEAEIERYLENGLLKHAHTGTTLLYYLCSWTGSNAGRATKKKGV